MKKYFLIAVVFVCVSCTIGSSENNEFVRLPVSGVEIPASFKKDSVSNFVLKYKRPTDCHIFNGIYYNAVNNERYVGINAVRLMEYNCQPETLTEFQVPLQFKPSQTGVYMFKFINGKDAAGKETYQTEAIFVE